MSSPLKKEEHIERSHLQIVRGLPVSARYKKEIIEEIFDFEPQDGDIIIASYPKTGTTWVQYIVHQVLTKCESFPAFNDMWDRVVPFLETAGVSAVKALAKKPRVYKHHFPYDVMKRNPKSKIIYVYRRPEDTLVSFYHFLKNRDVSIDFDKHFENFLTGYMSYGRYFEHVLSYLKHKDEKNILLLSYKKLQARTKEEILKIANFLGEEYYSDIVDDETLLEKIIERTSFDFMKKNLTLTMPEPSKQGIASNDTPKREVNFFRKGIVGDGKNSLKESQLKQLQQLMEEIMKNTYALQEWR